MRLVWLNRNPSTHPGGDLIMLRALKEAMVQRGHRCHELYGEWTSRDLLPFDLVLIYHVNFPWSFENITKTQLAGKPYVLLPIFYPTDQLGMTYRSMREAMEEAACVCPLSFTEAREISDYTGFRGPFSVIPHGTEERFHWDRGDQDCCVATSCARGGKGEDLVEKVCGKLGLPCKHFINIPHEELHLHYRKARVFVHSSPDDRMSLTVGEALCSGCRVLSSVYDRGNEWFPGLKVLNPKNEQELESYIRMAWESEKWDWRPNERAREMTWGKTAKAWEKVCERALCSN